MPAAQALRPPPRTNSRQGWGTRGTVSLLLLLGLAPSGPAVQAAERRLDADNAVITATATIAPGTYRIHDADNDGAVHIRGDDLVVDFQNARLDGARAGADPDAFTGTGIVVESRNITLRRLRVSGYKVGIHARNCPGLVIEDADISGNYQKHLRSTPQAEDGSDWIFPHQNDKREWIARYGAGLYVEKASHVTIRRVRARHGQNGIVLDRVTDSKVYDNDCSFLSGWGLALWRSSRNVITRNAFDFCIRGYSHGVYNRGQDSAGILLFEQNNENVIAENSATHGGDGLFGFGGEASLNGSGRTGNNANRIIDNDFSYAAAHGIEITFSFDNRIVGNRIVGNAICGIWGGYSQSTHIAGNRFEANGDAGYGLERGGINIEHGTKNRIEHNTFVNNKCGVHLWDDNDAGLLEKPWAKANHKGSTDNRIAFNTFTGDEVAVHLRATTNTTLVNNKTENVKITVQADEKSAPQLRRQPAPDWSMPDYPVFGDTRPVGARKHLRGRANMILTEWGPYDFAAPAVHPANILGGARAQFRVLGTSGTFRVADVQGAVTVSPTTGSLPATLTASATGSGVFPFSVAIEADGKTLRAKGTLVAAQWTVKFYKWKPADDPREHQDKWDALIAGPPLETLTVPAIDFKWAVGAPTPNVPREHFGTVATTTLRTPAGRYRIWTVSDDGIRVWVDKRRIIDDWTWHAPKENTAEIDLSAGPHTIRIEHFEIDGVAQLQLRLEPLPPAPSAK